MGLTPNPPNPLTFSSQFENNYFTETCSGSEAGSYLRLIDFVYHSTLGLRVIKKGRSYVEDLLERLQDNLLRHGAPERRLPVLPRTPCTPDLFLKEQTHILLETTEHGPPCTPEINFERANTRFAAERRGDNFKRFEGFHPKARTRISGPDGSVPKAPTACRPPRPMHHAHRINLRNPNSQKCAVVPRRARI